MKKILFVLAVCLVSLLSFSSCGTALEVSDYPYPTVVYPTYPYGGYYYYTPRVYVYPSRPYYRRPTPPPPPARRTPPRNNHNNSGRNHR